MQIPFKTGFIVLEAQHKIKTHTGRYIVVNLDNAKVLFAYTVCVGRNSISFTGNRMTQLRQLAYPVFGRKPQAQNHC